MSILRLSQTLCKKVVSARFALGDSLSQNLIVQNNIDHLFAHSSLGQEFEWFPIQTGLAGLFWSIRTLLSHLEMAVCQWGAQLEQLISVLLGLSPFTFLHTVVSGTREEQERASPSEQTLIKPLLASHLLTSLASVSHKAKSKLKELKKTFHFLTKEQCNFITVFCSLPCLLCKIMYLKYLKTFS